MLVVVIHFAHTCFFFQSPPDFLVKSAESFELGPVQVVEEEEEREPSPEVR